MFYFILFYAESVSRYVSSCGPCIAIRIVSWGTRIVSPLIFISICWSGVLDAHALLWLVFLGPIMDGSVLLSHLIPDNCLEYLVKGTWHDWSQRLLTKIILHEILLEFFRKVIQKCTNPFGKDWTINRAEITHKSIYLWTLARAIYVYKHCIIKIYLSFHIKLHHLCIFVGKER